MKFFLAAFLFIAMQSSSRGQVALQYELTLFDSSIHVELLFRPTVKDSATFTYGVLQFGGQADIFKGLQNVQAQSPARVKIDSANRKLTFYYPGSDPVKMNYDVFDTRSENTTRSQLFRPMIMKDYFFTHGVNLFLTPAFEAEGSTIMVSVEWKSKPPFPVFYAFDPDNDGSRIAVTTADSIAFRLLTGANDLFIKKFSSESGSNYLVLRSSGMSATVKQEVENFYLDYNAVMRKFWNDTRKINYSLVLQPYLNVNHSMSGISFGNGFIGKYNKPDSLALGERMFVISHEIGHYYLGGVSAFEGEDNIGQWFNEGFNDYLTFFNLVHAKRMNAAEFDSAFNQLFRSFYNSPIRNTPNNKIFENFWLLGDYAKLPYWRGCVFAFYLDNQLSIATRNNKSLRDLMLDLKALVAEKDKKEFTNEELINAVSKYLPRADFEKALQEYIINGTPIAFKNSMLLPIFHIELKDQTPVLSVANKKAFEKHFQFK